MLTLWKYADIILFIEWADFISRENKSCESKGDWKMSSLSKDNSVVITARVNTVNFARAVAFLFSIGKSPTTRSEAITVIVDALAKVGESRVGMPTNEQAKGFLERAFGVSMDRKKNKKEEREDKGKELRDLFLAEGNYEDLWNGVRKLTKEEQAEVIEGYKRAMEDIEIVNEKNTRCEAPKAHITQKETEVKEIVEVKEFARAEGAKAHSSVNEVDSDESFKAKLNGEKSLGDQKLESMRRFNEELIRKAKEGK